MAKVRGARKVKTKWIINLDKGSKLKVKSSDLVERGAVLAVLSKKNLSSVLMPELLLKLDKKKLSEKLEKEKGKKVKKGDLLFRLPGLFGKSVHWPETGTFVGIDDFYNFVFENEKPEKRKILSPVSAKVEEANSKKIVLSFRAIEFRGKPVVETKIWCQAKLDEGVLDCSCETKVVFKQELDEVFLAKAEVMSVAGIVSMENDNEVEINLPVLFLNKKDWQGLKRVMGGTEKQMLLNTRVGRLLVVV